MKVATYVLVLLNCLQNSAIAEIVMRNIEVTVIRVLDSKQTQIGPNQKGLLLYSDSVNYCRVIINYIHPSLGSSSYTPNKKCETYPSTDPEALKEIRLTYETLPYLVAFAKDMSSMPLGDIYGMSEGSLWVDHQSSEQELVVQSFDRTNANTFPEEEKSYIVRFFISAID